MKSPAWKARAESMLTQFIHGQHFDDEPTNADEFYSDSPSKFNPLYPRLENTSTPNPPPTCTEFWSSDEGATGVYERLRCGCVVGDSGPESGAGPCFSVLLTWAKIVFGRVTNAYLSSPLLLAILPLLIGAVIGFWMGRRGDGQSEFGRKRDSKLSRPTPWGRLHTFVSLCVKRSQETVFSIGTGLVMLFIQRQRSSCSNGDMFNDKRDEKSRVQLRNSEINMESGVDPLSVPRHIAVIMDGNRRYGRAKYGNATRGHWDGSKTLLDFSKWCISEGVQILTVYAFSTENWARDPAEVSALMAIFCKYFEELSVEAIERGIRIRVLSTEEDQIPTDVKAGIDRMVSLTQHCDKFTMNICLSYGGRGEIVNACRRIATDVREGTMDIGDIGEGAIQSRLLTEHCSDPCIIIRTSGEERLSNFLLWQAAYSEFFFLEKQWPELQKEDLLEVIRTYAKGRQRRFGK